MAGMGVPLSPYRVRREWVSCRRIGFIHCRTRFPDFQAIAIESFEIIRLWHPGARCMGSSPVRMSPTPSRAAGRPRSLSQFRGYLQVRPGSRTRRAARSSSSLNEINSRRLLIVRRIAGDIRWLISARAESVTGGIVELASPGEQAKTVTNLLARSLHGSCEARYKEGWLEARSKDQRTN